MVGGGAAALTGLVFVALTLSLHIVSEDATHRYRAITTLTVLASSFMVCDFALMAGLNHFGLGIEWLVLAIVGLWVWVMGFFQSSRAGGSRSGLTPIRMFTGSALYVAQVVGAALIFAGVIAGLYMAAASMILLLGFATTAAWLLVTGMTDHPHPPEL